MRQPTFLLVTTRETVLLFYCNESNDSRSVQLFHGDNAAICHLPP